jgi:hypothetical protein
VDGEKRTAEHHRLHAVRAHLLEMVEVGMEPFRQPERAVSMLIRLRR